MMTIIYIYMVVIYIYMMLYDVIRWLYIYIDLGKLQRPHCSPSLEIMVSKGNHPHVRP